MSNQPPFNLHRTWWRPFTPDLVSTSRDGPLQLIRRPFIGRKNKILCRIGGVDQIRCVPIFSISCNRFVSSANALIFFHAIPHHRSASSAGISAERKKSLCSGFRNSFSICGTGMVLFAESMSIRHHRCASMYRAPPLGQNGTDTDSRLKIHIH